MWFLIIVGQKTRVLIHDIFHHFTYNKILFDIVYIICLMYRETWPTSRWDFNMYMPWYLLYYLFSTEGLKMHVIKQVFVSMYTLDLWTEVDKLCFCGKAVFSFYLSKGYRAFKYCRDIVNLFSYSYANYKNYFQLLSTLRSNISQWLYLY